MGSSRKERGDETTGEPEDERGAEQACDGVDDIVGLDINGGTAEEGPKGKQDDEQTWHMATCQDKYNGGDADVTTGEGRRGTLTRGLSTAHQMIEDSVAVARRR